ncbi:MAG TPA: DUF1488 family protein [Gemmatimonadales bacterium]|nr:DUF1488 family protein [Gemmatimonadales bacterium]
MDIAFESRRLYVAPRKSVLFFARIGDHRVRCYVEQDALIERARALREETDLFQRCLLAFDDHKDLIQAAARRLIAAKVDDLHGAVVVSSAALTFEAEVGHSVLEATKVATR